MGKKHIHIYVGSQYCSQQHFPYHNHCLNHCYRYRSNCHCHFHYIPHKKHCKNVIIHAIKIINIKIKAIHALTVSKMMTNKRLQEDENNEKDRNYT